MSRLTPNQRRLAQALLDLRAARKRRGAGENAAAASGGVTNTGATGLSGAGNSGPSEYPHVAGPGETACDRCDVRCCANCPGKYCSGACCVRCADIEQNGFDPTTGSGASSDLRKRRGQPAFYAIDVTAVRAGQVAAAKHRATMRRIGTLKAKLGEAMRSTGAALQQFGVRKVPPARRADTRTSGKGARRSAAPLDRRN
jgi:hypothetical protein